MILIILFFTLQARVLDRLLDLIGRTRQERSRCCLQVRYTWPSSSTGAHTSTRTHTSTTPTPTSTTSTYISTLRSNSTSGSSSSIM